jgi:2-polyprenyl-6-methoxyphenol hydroxylase-like FAD-dependent oxidoreductase
VSVEHHRVVIVGGGAAGVTVAARLGRADLDDVALIEPSDRHYYQPLWTLGGAAWCRRRPASGPRRRSSRYQTASAFEHSFKGIRQAFRILISSVEFDECPCAGLTSRDVAEVGA